MLLECLNVVIISTLLSIFDCLLSAGNLEMLLLVCKKNRVSDSGFGYPWVLVLRMNLYPKRSSGWVRVLSSGFGFGCPDTPPEPNPTRCHPYISRENVDDPVDDHL